jgi:hypothetical protein
MNLFFSFFLKIFVSIFQLKRISGTGKMQAKFEKYQKNTYVVKLF